MQPLDSILASDNETLFKLVGAVVVLIIWGISSLASSVGKARQNAAKQQQKNRMAMSAAPQRSPLKPAITPRAPAALPPLPSRSASSLPLLRTLASPPPRPTAAKPTPRPKAPAPAPGAPRMQPAAVQSRVGPSAVTNLLRPKTVRAQFILAEVLQPPVALRNRKSF